MVRVVRKYVVCQRAKGKEYFYFRYKGDYVKLPAMDTPPFEAAYAKQLARVKEELPTAPPIPGSFGELVEKYIASADYQKLAASTRAEFRRHLDRMKAMWGEYQARRLKRGAVLEYRDVLKDTPRKASYAMQVLRRLLSFGVDRGMLDTNPAARPGITGPAREHQPWTDDEIATFQRVNADRPMMILALLIGLCSGQRRGDLVKMTRADYGGAQIAVMQNKTREKVWIPVHASLKLELDKLGRFMLLETPRGKAFTPRHLSNLFLDACRRANLNGLSIHGLRVTAATWMARAGCTDAELQTILGHRTVVMAAKYRRAAQKEEMARSAMSKLEHFRAKI